MELDRDMKRARQGPTRDTSEEPLDPALPICDPHHHLWDHRERYLVEEFESDIRCGHNIVATVFVEAGAGYRRDGPRELQPVGETEFVEAITAARFGAKHRDSCIAAGIVGYADLTLGSGVYAVLEAHLSASPERFRGIRHSATWDSDATARGSAPGPGLLMESSYRAGVACLERYGLTYDAWLFHTQLADLVSLAREFPATTIVLNHVGAPLGVGRFAGRRKEVFDAWSSAIKEVASCPNVVVKLGGLGMARCGFNWSQAKPPPSSTELAKAMAPYFLLCIDCFGPERCMFESNFPVDRSSYSYLVLWNCFKRITSGFSEAERAAMFYGTAARTYRLGAPQGDFDNQ